MKAKRFIAPIIALLIFLSACSGQRQSGKNENGKTDKNIVMLTEEYGILTQKYALREDGCYEFVQGSGFNGNILYTDYESASRIFLSSDPAGDHFTPRDTSYVADFYGTCALFSYGDNLLLLHSASPGAIDFYGKKALSRLERAELNGRDRKTFYTFEDDRWIDNYSGIAFDGESLYMIVSRMKEENLRRTELVKISLSGEKQVLKELDTDKKYRICSSRGGRLIIRRTVYPDSETPWFRQISRRRQEVFLFDTDTLDERELFVYSENDRTLFYSGDRIFISDSQNGELRQADIYDGDEKTVITFDKLPGYRESPPPLWDFLTTG